MTDRAYVRYTGKRKHIRRDAQHTFCGNKTWQRTKRGPTRLYCVSPNNCTCTPCLTKYYLANPMQKAKTK